MAMTVKHSSFTKDAYVKLDVAKCVSIANGSLNLAQLPSLQSSDQNIQKHNGYNRQFSGG